MRRAKIVIGANFGDEGKGILTDYFVNQYGKDALVVRHSSGAQAGHTVTTPNGKRHVFSHFGSGSFAGAPTYLSRFFISNPLLFFKEMALLKGDGVKPIVYADKDGLVSTPYDMLINQMLEDARGTARHGSCGMGVNETIERSLLPEYRITVGDLGNPDLYDRLDRIRRFYVPQRLTKLGVSGDNPHLMWESLLDRTMEDFMDYRAVVNTCDIAIIRDTKKTIIFEGAQGLLLDEDHPWFPHVTRSKTGIKNAVTLAKESGIGGLDVTYVTRAYLTRHGAGPLPHEVSGLPYPNIIDRTNIPNAYQGSLRFAWLDLDLIKEAIANDLQNGIGIEVDHRLAITCLDQVGDSVRFYQDDEMRTETPTRFVDLAIEAVGASGGLMSYGPTRADVISTVDAPFASCDRTLSRSLVN